MKKRIFGLLSLDIRKACNPFCFICTLLFFFTGGHLYSQNYLRDGAITTSGTYTVPEGVTAIMVEAWGGGGAGGYSGSNGQATGGGGGGAYAKVYILPVTPGEELSIMIGKGGLGTPGIGNGGNTYMQRGEESILYATGGFSLNDNGAEGGLGGQAINCIGDISYSGGKGGNGGGSGPTAGAGGGGAGAGRSNDGDNGGNGADNVGGAGGAGTNGGGSGGRGVEDCTYPPQDGGIYGGGGGGAKRKCTGGAGQNGGNGGDGIMIVSFCPIWAMTNITAPAQICENITSVDLTFTGNSMGLVAGTYSVTLTIEGVEQTINDVSVTKIGELYTGIIRNVTIPAEATNTTIAITQLAKGDCSNTITENNMVTITRLPAPVKPIIAPDGLTICTGTGTGELTAEGTYTNPVYQWYINGQIMAQTTQTITINQSASYYVTVTDQGCSNSSDPHNYLVQANATANLIAANPVDACNGNTATLTATLAAGANVTNPVFRWYADQTSSEVLGTGATFTTGTLTTTVLHDTTFYVSVAGSIRYCENTPGTRKPVTVTIHPMPTVRVTTDQSTIFCHNATIDLKAEISGAYDWIGWYDEPLNSGTFLPNNLNVVDVTYNPLESSQGKDLKAYVRVHNAGCGYISGTALLHILPEPTAAVLGIMEQPIKPQNVCADTFYVVRVVAPNLGDVTNLVLTLHDVNSTGLAIKADADIIYSDAPTVTVAGTEPVQEIDRPGKQWNLPGTLQAGDFLDVKIKVQATCDDFKGGTDLHFNLDAQSVCGDRLPRLEVRTLPFNIVQDGIYNTYNLTSQFRDSKGQPITKVTNNISDTIIWHLEASFKEYKKPTDGDVELVNVLIPNGMKLIDGSYDPIQNMPDKDVVNIDTTQQQNGLNVNISLESGVTPQSDDGGKMIAELKFLATGAPCDIYEFYAKIDYKYEAYCVSNESTCTVNTTQGAAPDNEVLLEVERYRFVVDSLYSETREDDLWYATVRVKALMDWYAGNTVYIDFYVDEENDGVLYDGQQPIARHTYITEDVPEGGTFLDRYSGVPAVPGQQLLAKVHGDAMCETLLSPMIVMTGDRNVACQNDTITFSTAEKPGIIDDYFWGVTTVDAVSGATPWRIPVEGKTSVDEVPNVARIVWPAEGEFLVTTHYDLNGENLNSTYFPVTIEKAPSITFPDGKTFSLCAGSSVNIPITTEAASSVEWSNFAATGTATGTTTNTLHYVPSQRTLDTTIYIRITAYCLEGSICRPVTDSVKVVIYGKPEFKFAGATACGSVNLATLPLVSGSIGKILDFEYWNEDFTEEVTNQATAITQSGTYHIIGIAAYCSDTSTVRITVKPIPQLTIADSDETQSVCSGSPVIDPGLSSDVDETTYTITSTATPGITGNTASATGLTQFPADPLTTSATAPGSVSYTITPIAAGCEGDPKTYTVTVNPIPVLTLASNKTTMCSGTTVPSPGMSSNITGGMTTYNITSTADGVSGNTTSITGQTVFVSDNLICTGTTSGTVTYTITPVFAGCPGRSQTYTVTVNPIPPTAGITMVPSDGYICSGENAVLTANGTYATTATYSWYKDIDGILIPINGETTSTLTTGDAGSYVVIVTETGCSSEMSNPVTVTVNSLPAATISENGEICEGARATLTITLTQGEPTPSWSAVIGVYVDDVETETITDGFTDVDSTTKTISVSPQTTTVYKIKSVTDGNGCTRPL